MQSNMEISKLLNIESEVLGEISNKMGDLTEKEDVLNNIEEEIKAKIEEFNKKFNLSSSSYYSEVLIILGNYIKSAEEKLKESLGKENDRHKNMIDLAVKISGRKTGFFVKKEKAQKMLEEFPPQNILDHLNYSSVSEMIINEDVDQILSALRFAQDKEWMHKFFDESYTGINKNDFEEREVSLIVLEPNLLDMATKFSGKKFHNVSHLKEFGIIFINPNISETGELFRDFTLLLHYLNEVPFYSKLVRRYSENHNFDEMLKSLLRGDVPEGETPIENKPIWRIVQRYLRKDDPNDPRLFEKHINPEAEHWYKAMSDLENIKNILPADKTDWMYPWKDLDFTGAYYKDEEGKEKMMSFNLIDIIITVVKKGEETYEYHQQEALWNKIFIEYMGRDKMNQIIEENILTGFANL